MFPQCSTSQAAVGLGILLSIFDIGKMVLVQVEVKSTWVVAKGAVNQLCSNIWYCIFFFSIVFISLFSTGLGGFKGIGGNVHFIEVFQISKFFQPHTEKLLFLREKFSVSLIVMLCIPLCQSPKKALIVVVDFSIIGVAIQGDQTMVLGQIGRQVSITL